MRTIERQTEAQLHLQAGLEELVIQDCNELHLKLDVDKCSHTLLLVSYHGSKMKSIVDIQLCDEAQVSVLFLNELSDAMELQLRIHSAKDARVHIGIGDLSSSKANYEIVCHLANSGMDAHITTVAIAKEKQWKMHMVHETSHTSSLMENFAVVEDCGVYQMEATGKIMKGAYGSSSHQASRVLTMSQDQKSDVTPVLLIDENDVKASHATTIGQPDESQLYYLQSRGLSRQAALGLLTLGYLMPIVEVIDDEEIRTRIQKQIEERVIVHV